MLAKQLLLPFVTPREALTLDVNLTDNTKSEKIGHRPINNQDRQSYYKLGEKYEDAFVTMCQQRKLNAKINPEKEFNKTKPDLLMFDKVSDLKTQTLPFFKSDRYGVSPEDSITFNRKDYERYKRLYPKIDIYVWRGWEEQEAYGVKVKKVIDVLWLPFKKIAKLIEDGAKEHFYQQRINDRFNAKSSFILNRNKFYDIAKKCPART